ncbi:MAG: 3-oxoacyl-ACP synthase [Firmicutes bacterium]|nr:3-oxoacyl-ACP synthase [Bacillota bacterium]
MSWGVYLPPGYHDSAYMAQATGIAEEVIQAKFGLRRKHKAGADEHISDMAEAAARAAIKAADIDPDRIDTVIYYGSEYKDYPLWNTAAKIQHMVGARNAFSFNIMALCASGIVAMKVAKDMLRADPYIKTVLMVAASREADLINYHNERARFMYNFADGAAAMILQRGHSRNLILNSALITDGSFADDVIVPTGGTKIPLTPQLVEEGMFMLDVRDPKAMKLRLDPISTPNFLRVIDLALNRSGYTREHIAFFGGTHMKRSIYEEIVTELGLPLNRVVYLEDHGHVQAADQILVLAEGTEKGILKEGDVAVLVGAGTGYTWGATVIRWG